MLRPPPSTTPTDTLLPYTTLFRSPSFLFCPVKGRCYVSNAARHRGNRVVHCLDIKKFFPNTPRVRVIAFFQSIMGCRADVAGILGDLCTFEGHLPTGSPL